MLQFDFQLHYHFSTNILIVFLQKIIQPKNKMNTPSGFYSQNITSFTQNLSVTGKRIYLLGTIRLIVVLSCIAFVYFCWDKSWGVISIIALIHFIVFCILLKISNKLSWKKEYLQHLLQINTNEKNGLKHDFSAFDGYAERINPQHPFSFDLDIFGERSVFQSINRAKMALGKVFLADWFEKPLTDKSEILKRREAIKELSNLPDLCQKFTATGMFNPGKLQDVEDLRQFAGQKDFIANKSVWKILSVIIPVLWLILFILMGMSILSFPAFTIAFFVTLAISYCITKKVGKLQQSLERKVKFLSTYSYLLKIIEEENFTSALLSEKKGIITENSKKASTEIKRLSSYLNSLELRKTFPAGFFLNILFLWEIKYAIKIEDWKNSHQNHIEKWLKILGEFDALCSLGTFAFNHPTYTYPEISDEYFHFEAKNLGHPLLRNEVCVRNDIDIPQSPYFLIVTGANMAGKSTYLRTVGVNYLLGCLGTPVCSDKMIFSPVTMISSLRTADSLVNSESYFFAELKRLSGIIERLKSGEKLFIILDEILKGTNSLDKQKGSLALIKQFISLKSCGIVATHDLSLGELATVYPNQIQNICFEADIKDNELHFSYKLRNGIAQNMNACFLMKKMGITVDD